MQRGRFTERHWRVSQRLSLFIPCWKWFCLLKNAEISTLIQHCFYFERLKCANLQPATNFSVILYTKVKRITYPIRIIMWHGGSLVLPNISFISPTVFHFHGHLKGITRSALLPIAKPGWLMVMVVSTGPPLSSNGNGISKKPSFPEQWSQLLTSQMPWSFPWSRPIHWSLSIPCWKIWHLHWYDLICTHWIAHFTPYAIADSLYHQQTPSNLWINLTSGHRLDGTSLHLARALQVSSTALKVHQILHASKYQLPWWNTKSHQAVFFKHKQNNV